MAKFKAAVFILVLLFLGSLPGELWAQSEKVFFYGFEKEKLLTWLKMWKDEGDTCHIVCPGERVRYNWTIRKGEATEGDWAFIISIGMEKLISPTDLGKIDDGYKLFKTKGDNYREQRINRSDFDWTPGESMVVKWRRGRIFNYLSGDEAQKAVESGYYNFESAVNMSHALFLTSRSRMASGGEDICYTEEAFPRNWSAYNYLRMDIKSEKAEFKIRMAFEDDEIAPPVERRFIVPPGKWVTLEMDLKEAEKERKVDLSKIVTFWTFCEESSGPTMVYIDNIRLSPKGVDAKHPVIHGGPKLPRPIIKMPEVQAINLQCNLTPLTLTKPIIIPDFPDYDKGYNTKGSARIFAYDNDRLLIYNVGQIRGTIDGGKTWENLTGKGDVKGGASAWNPWFSTAFADSGAAKPAHMTDKGDILAFGGFGPCLYHNAPSIDSRYFRKLIFKGNGWVGSPLYIAAGETRHCTADRITSSKSGKYWCAVFVFERRIPPEYLKSARLHIHAWCSDDGGVTWQAPGKDGLLSDSRIGGIEDYADLRLGHPGTKHGFTTFFIFPYKDEVACIWEKRRESSYNPECFAFFSFFENGKWRKPQLIGTTTIGTASYSAVSLKEEIFLSTDKGIFRWDGTRWFLENGSPKNAILAVCGNEKLLTFTVEEDGNKVANRILLWRRSPDGGWQSQEIVKEERAIGWRNEWSKDAWAKLLMNTMPNSPSNFAPLVWSTEGGGEAKLLKVPSGPIDQRQKTRD